MSVDVVWVLVVLGALGGLVQGSIGFGFGLVATPVLALYRPDLVPVAVQVAVLTLLVATLRYEWRHADWRAFGWVMAGSVPGTVAAALVVAAVSARTMQLLVGGVVLVMVGLSLRRTSGGERPLILVGAGLVSGVTGTMSGVGGPPVALTLGRHDPARTRATLALIFFAGDLVTLGSLAGAGVVTRGAVLGGLVMVPGIVLGFLAAVRLRAHLTSRAFGRGVLAVSSIAAVVLIVRALVAG